MKNKNHLMMTGYYTVISNEIAKLLGNDSAILLAYLARKKEDFENSLVDGFFYNIAEDIEQTTHLTRWKYESALKKLVEQGFVETKTEGVHYKKYFKINDLVIENKIEEMTQTSNFTLSVTDKVLCESPATTNKAITRNQNVTSSIQKFPVEKKVASQDRGFAPAVVSKRFIIKKQSKRELIRANNPSLVKKAIFSKKKRKVLVPKITDDIQTIVDYWISKGMKSHREDTLSFAQVIRDIHSLFKGTLFNTFKNKMWHNRKFRVSEVKKTIDNFVLAANNADYEPISIRTKQWMQKLPFSNFFYNKRASEENYKSMFLTYLVSAPTLVSNSKIFAIKDETPNVTKILTDWYKKTFGNRDNDSFTLKNKNDLIFTSKALKEFYEKNKTKLNIKNWLVTYGQTDPIAFLAVQVTRALDKMLRENGSLYVSFTTAWMKSDKMIEERLPSFLRQEHMI